MKEYKGISAAIFKDRFGNHKKAFNNKSYKLDRELSKEVWAIRDKNGHEKITWTIYRHYPPYTPKSKRCSLCQNEKLEIALHKEGNLLNKRSEIISKCRHRNKYKLKVKSDNIK